jgi:glc operon protein GlcG
MRLAGRSTAALGLAALVVAVARAGSAAGGVTYLPGDQVAAAFAKGAPLIETEAYKVHASRRDGPGQVEIHARDTDIIYVLTGTATFVTGGEIVGGVPTAPEEVRGPSMSGGEARTLRPGDLVIVPNGTTHWFKEVPAPMTYYVVKVRAAGESR